MATLLSNLNIKKGYSHSSSFKRVNKIRRKMVVHLFSSKNHVYFSSALHQALTDKNVFMHTSWICIYPFLFLHSCLPKPGHTRGTWKSLKVPRQHKLFFFSMSHPGPSKSRESQHAVNFSVIFLMQSQNTPCIMPSCWTPGRHFQEKNLHGTYFW